MIYLSPKISVSPCYFSNIVIHIHNAKRKYLKDRVINLIFFSNTNPLNFLNFYLLLSSSDQIIKRIQERWDFIVQNYLAIIYDSFK